jgi:F420-non-reducing hydrogenase small subunit
MAEKPKLAFYWCAACGGCEEAVLDLEEKLLDVVSSADIVFWPVALDFKRHDLEAMADASLTAAFISGAIRTTEQQEMVRLLRSKSQLVFAFGSCAQLGGVPGLANLWTRDTIFQAAYAENASTPNPDGTLPQMITEVDGVELMLPPFFDTVRTLHQVIAVDYYVPGCPPTPKILLAALNQLLSGQLPEKGAVLAPDHGLCEDCPRRDTHPEHLALDEFKRPHEVLIDEGTCLLAQGILCLGPATRAGCEALCIKGNMPCTGCFGPTSRVRDFGGKALSAIASVVAAKEEAGIVHALKRIPDPVGAFYRYSLPSSLLRRRRLQEHQLEPARSPTG